MGKKTSIVTTSLATSTNSKLSSEESTMQYSNDSRNHSINAIPAVTSTDDTAAFSNITITSAKTLDQVISEMSKTFAEGTDYFKILVKVFQEVRNFFLIFYNKKKAFVVEFLPHLHRLN